MAKPTTPKSDKSRGAGPGDWLDADWEKGGGLLPAIIQDADTGQVLMLGYMNREAARHTVEGGRVAFHSRSRNCLWVKGESSGNYLEFVDASTDCDRDTILVQARPAGPVCHTGERTCFGNMLPDGAGFIAALDRLVRERRKLMPKPSYTTSLFEAGKQRIAQKVGEEGVEIALARMKGDRAEIAEEAGDLIYHLLVLLADAGMSFDDCVDVLQKRNAADMKGGKVKGGK